MVEAKQFRTANQFAGLVFSFCFSFSFSVCVVSRAHLPVGVVKIKFGFEIDFSAIIVLKVIVGIV